MKTRILTILLLIASLVTACAPTPVETPAASPASSTPISSGTIIQPPTETVIPIPTLDPSPTSTLELVTLEAIVWIQEPLVPILLYHYFIPDEQDSKDFTQMRLGDFRSQLEELYDAGFSLVQVEEWLKGNMSVAEGRRPLAITLDDLFLSNQLELDDNGNPSPDSGLGVLWQFSQEHPDFGFEVMLFVNFGDKSYGVVDPQERRLKQANAVVWCIEHGARIYNHTFNHIDLQYSTPEEIKADLALHDTYLHEILALVGREDLLPLFGNMLAVPYSWPLSAQGYQVMQEYTNPEGVPMQAVFGSAYFKNAPPMPPPYTPGFDPFNIKRFEVNPDALNYLVKNPDNFPAAQSCMLTGLDLARTDEPDYLAGQIQSIIRSGACPSGTYALSGFVFNAWTSGVALIYP